MSVSSRSKTHSSFREFAQHAAPKTGRVLGAIVAVIAVVLAAWRIIPLGAATAGFFCLVIIVVIARGWGIVEGVAASVAAALCLDYFSLPRLGSFSLTKPASIEAFIGFIAAAIAISLLASRKLHSQDWIDREREMERLYALSRAILLMDPWQPVAKQIAYQMAQIFQFASVAFYDRNSGEILRAGPEDLPGIDDKLRAAAVQGTLFHEENSETIVTAVRLGGMPIGSMALRGRELSDGALHALSNLVAVGLERVRVQEAASQADAARQSQELKSTLLDAIAHEFKTPLTSIRAATTALLSGSVSKLMERRELISIVDEETDRLARLVNEIIQMARIEGGKSQISKGLQSARALIEAALAPVRTACEAREFRVSVQPDVPPVEGDAELLGVAIRQLIDNSVKYSPPDTVITLSARASEGQVHISVADQGRGIPEGEQARIFEKFYRSPSSSRQVVGTGMGLAIAQKIVSAHGGAIRVQSRPGEGAEFIIALPGSDQEIVA